ncbi:hypothetical protein GmHk_14G040759 [Glycine max]|nr:hypothetical protein GmHk_14G040759 [Glycine max]
MNYLSLLLPLCLLNLLAAENQNPERRIVHPRALSGSPYSSLSQTGLRFRDCNHIVEFVFVEFVSATYRLSSKKTRKRKSPGKGGNRFWKSIVVGLKTLGAFFFFLLLPEFIFVANWPALPSKKTRKGKSPGKGGNRFWKSIVVGFKTPREAIEGDFFVFFSRCQGSLLIVFCVLVSDQC